MISVTAAKRLEYTLPAARDDGTVGEGLDFRADDYPARNQLGLRELMADSAMVSFDLFDTLLCRRFARPVDVFEFVGRACNVPSFGRDRVRAELAARQRKALAENTEETTLDEIYTEVQRLLPRHAERLRNEELAAEARLLYPNEPGMAAYRLALSLGKPVIVVTDMYLPSSFLRRILDAHGCRPERIFVSAELGVSKGRDGMAFRRIAAEIGIEPARILHIGDNPEADCYQALRAGWRGFSLVNPGDKLFRDARINQAAIHRLMTSEGNLFGPYLVSYLAERLQRDDGLDVVRHFGRMYAAPLLFAFVSWLDDIRQRDGVSRLLLLTRDGHALQPLFALIGSAAHVTVLNASRRMAYIATMADNFDDTCEDLAKSAIGVTVHAFLAGLEFQDPTPLQQALARWIDPDLVVESHSDAELLHRALLRCRPELLAVAAQERAVLASYLEQMQVTAPDTAIVDCGWGLSIHHRFERIAGRQIRGYYLGTTNPTRMHGRIRAFLFAPHEASEWSALHRESVELLELPFVAGEPRVVRMSDSDGPIAAVASRSNLGAERLRGTMATAIREEVAAFCRAAAWLRPWLSHQEVSDTLLILFRSLIRTPTHFEYFGLAPVPHARSIGEHGLETIGRFWVCLLSPPPPTSPRATARQYISLTLRSLRRDGIYVTWYRIRRRLRFKSFTIR